MRVLLAIDGSRSSIQARDLVLGLEWAAGTAIRFVTVFEPPVAWTGGTGAGVAWVADAQRSLHRELAAELERLAEPAAHRAWQIDCHVVEGHPATAIVRAASRFGADLIVVGSRGRGPLTSVLLGSVSAEVVDLAPCSVLVARGDRVTSLTIATDGSDAARGIAEQLGAWHVFDGLAGEALSVAPLPERTYQLLADVYTVGAYRFGDDRQALLDRHRRFADQLAQQLAAHRIRATASVVAGDAADEIIESARRRGTDLIVTGTRGLHGLERVLLGSVARNVVLQAPCSVLVIRRSSAARRAAHHGARPATRARIRA